jgi:hypothetical protein
MHGRERAAKQVRPTSSSHCFGRLEESKDRHTSLSRNPDGRGDVNQS